MTKAKISISSKPPTQGQQATISGAPDTTYNIEWVPPNAGPTTVTTNDQGEVVITIPANATAMTISGGGAVALSTSIIAS